ncbi:hypothetical protein EJ110_NYTH49974 [Nymphaea thermarum]|nr:hypothetical protein EJ110_NYTH49974 [Nymphaea thermarum]
MNSTIQGTSLIKENRQSRMPRMPMHLSYSYHRDDSASQVSATFSGPHMDMDMGVNVGRGYKCRTR